MSKAGEAIVKFQGPLKDAFKISKYVEGRE